MGQFVGQILLSACSVPLLKKISIRVARALATPIADIDHANVHRDVVAGLILMLCCCECLGELLLRGLHSQ